MKPECSVRGLISKGAMCGHVIVGGMKCGYSGECSHKRAPASAQAWHDAPTCAGLWLSTEDNENPYQWAVHKLGWPLPPDFINTESGERWYGPIPEDKP